MKQKSKEWTTDALKSANFLSRRRVQSTLKLAEKLINDPDKDKRLERQLCKACFYFTGIAGQAFTPRDCACCGKEQMYSSTNTDALCEPCAKNGNLCKHCGGDIELREDRQDWPTNTSTAK